jgi:hypothetical protein
MHHRRPIFHINSNNNPACPTLPDTQLGISTLVVTAGWERGQYAAAGKQEDLQSLMKLANAYMTGRGVAQDMSKAVDLLRSASRGGGEGWWWCVGRGREGRSVRGVSFRERGACQEEGRERDGWVRGGT